MLLPDLYTREKQMTDVLRADQIMLNMGFPESENGPYVTELRQRISEQVKRGLRNRSAGTWAEDAECLTYEERAKHLLAWEWENDHAHTYLVECMDGFDWRNMRPWIGDRLREFGMMLRVWRDTHLLRKTNPYLEARK